MSASPLPGHEIKGYEMGTGVTLRCECGWSRAGTRGDLDALAEQVTQHLGRVIRLRERFAERIQDRDLEGA